MVPVLTIVCDRAPVPVSQRTYEITERGWRLQVQCCGGGVRLRGSARGPPRVETRRQVFWTTLNTALHHLGQVLSITSVQFESY
jgi:hypothetical protein